MELEIATTEIGKRHICLGVALEILKASPEAMLGKRLNSDPSFCVKVLTEASQELMKYLYPSA